jgi:poly-gamma-glutamate capsule biosynthesis protein CapA/YwtB (metallophosphatase superfamily)
MHQLPVESAPVPLTISAESDYTYQEDPLHKTKKEKEKNTENAKQNSKFSTILHVFSYQLIGFNNSKRGGKRQLVDLFSYRFSLAS